MDRPIVVGDLVMVVRFVFHCPPRPVLAVPNAPGVRYGHIFTVGSLKVRGKCCRCGLVYEGAFVGPNDGRAVAVPVSWLKLIDPPATGDSLPTREKLEA